MHLVRQKWQKNQSGTLKQQKIVISTLKTAKEAKRYVKNGKSF
ncbi:hypothetical protein BMWSH_2343 [Priestia megaterium WSH-002]|uniref:Uncharacterized protein n=1 Tax=Priestia megaterium (strain WSH-002) TaxID=1006007 RepID=A0A8D3X023_PRIMW|nr:hypothetical protein BMWSH_2343 [Priestia megaterium WSH-002]